MGRQVGLDPPRSSQRASPGPRTHRSTPPSGIERSVRDVVPLSVKDVLELNCQGCPDPDSSCTAALYDGHSAGPADPPAPEGARSHRPGARAARQSLGRGDGLAAPSSRGSPLASPPPIVPNPTGTAVGSSDGPSSRQSWTGCGAQISRGQLCQRLGIDQQRHTPAGPRPELATGSAGSPAGSRSPSRAFEGHRRLRLRLTILARRIVPRLIARADARNPTGLCPEPRQGPGPLDPIFAM